MADTVATLKNAQEGKVPYMLYEITDIPNTSLTLYLTNYAEDVVFDGNTYTRFNVSTPNLSSNSQGQIDTVTLEVGNVDRTMQNYVEEFDGFRTAKVTFKLVFPELVAETSLAVSETFYVKSCETNADKLTFNLSTELDVLQKQIGRMVLRDRCPWTFKGAICGYSGSETFCDKTLGRCKELGNEARYGGFPGMPSQGTIIRI